MQTNFQAVLVTSEGISFAIFLYDENDLGLIMETSPMKVTGFSEADGGAFLSLNEYDRAQELVFRIDGMKITK